MGYDIIIIGGGPAGITAAIYALRANKKVLLLEKEVIGGKIISSPLIENYPGIQEIKGAQLSENLYQQLLQLGGEIKTKSVIEIQDKGEIKLVITQKETYEAKAIIIATGTKYKTLGLEKEKQLIGKGISFCAVCDGFFYRNKKVAVIGGGNTAIANALELANLCQIVFVIQNQKELTAEPILIQQLKEKQNVEIIYQTTVTEIMGEEKLIGIKIETEGKIQELEIDGMFLAIGQIPETTFLQKGIVRKDDKHYIEVDKDYQTNVKAIFAAGDCVSKEVRQLTTAVNDGTIAALKAVEYLNNI